MPEITENSKPFMPKIESKADFDLWGHLLKMSKYPTSIPGDYARDLRVTDGAVRFWLCLNIISNTDSESWWHQATMAKMFDLSEESIKRYYIEFKKAGWLEKYKMRKRGKLQNIKRLIWPDYCLSPRIKGAKRKAKIKEMEEKINNINNNSGRYRTGNNGGFSKAF